MSGRDSLWETHVVTGSQRELAEYILEQWRMEGDVIHEDGFYFYDPDSGTWFEREIEACRRDVLALNGRIYGPKMLTSAGDVKQSRVKMTDRLCNSVLRVVATLANRRERTSDPGFFDEAPPGVLAGGVFLTAEGGEVVEQALSPAWRQRFALDLDYDRRAQCRRWERALKDWFGEDEDGARRAALLGEFVGGALFGVSARYQKALFLVAPGGNGKSQLLDVVSALFEGGCATAIRPQDWSNEYQRAALSRSYVNIVPELPSKAIAEGANFKAIITGDPIGAREIYKKPFTFRPRAGHIFSGNAFPDALDTSDGFWRRILVLLMPRRFDGTEGEIRDLGKRIVHEELPGVLNWAVRGAKRLLEQDGYTIPASSQAAVEAWRRDSDPVASWLHNRTEPAPGPGLGLRTTELFADYKAWSESYGFPLRNLNHFSKALVRLVGPPKRTERGSLQPLLLKSRVEL